MRVGVLTFHNAHNYGAVLQAYALKKVITRMGYKIQIINYCNKAIESQYPMILDTVDNQKQNDWIVKYRRFNEFINKYLLEGNTDIVDHLGLNETDFDCYIVGSDQVWEPTLTGGLDSTYLLDWCINKLKISYAASKSEYRMDEETVKKFISKLKEFDYVSVREHSLSNWLEKCGIKNDVVLDPTLLLDDTEYDLITVDKVYGKPYVFVYYVNEDNGISKFAETIAKEKDLDIVEIHYYRVQKDGIVQFSDSGPLEMLSLIKNADYIVTNSFHGVALSITYKKNFYAYYERDSRKDNLLKELEIEDRHVWNNFSVNYSDVEYKKVETLLEEKRKKSIDFLKNALSNNG